jgi:putative pyruvate formate lyase activating enzyme
LTDRTQNNRITGLSDNTLFNLYENCTLCPRRCGVNRNAGVKGRCHESSDLYVSRAALHYWEEPCISGTTGSGTVFFSGCNLGCVYCQNYDISRGDSGKKIPLSRLAEIYFELEKKGAANINLVTPTHYIPHILKSIESAKEKGFSLPFVYNTSGYENASSISLLKGHISVFLTDLRYLNPDNAEHFSRAKDYPDKAKEALSKMFETTGAPIFDKETGLMKKGVIVRILVLPGQTEDAMNITEYLYKTYGDGIYISFLRQYTPISQNIPEGEKYRSLTRRLTTYEYEKVIDFALNLGIKNAYMQERGTEKESFIPAFDNEGV